MARLGRVLSMFLVGLAALLLVTWTIGRTASDRWLWSQYIAWIPPILLIPPALAAAAMSFVPARPRRRWPRRVVAMWAILGALHLAFVDLRLHRLPIGPRPSTPHLRLVHWNVTAIQRLHQVRDPLLAQNADIAFLVNPHSDVGWAEFPAAVGPEYHVIRTSGFVIASRLPVLRYAVAWLGLPGLPPESESSLPRRYGWTDPGRALYLELDTREVLGRTTILWALDLPSEPKLARWKIARDAGAIISSWTGAEMLVKEGGLIEGNQSTGFPPADIVVGDFNMTRGSVSIAGLLPGMRHAFDEAGAGYPATWPRAGFRTPIPLFHIDHMFVSSAIEVARYEVVDPGYGYHQMQVGDVVAGGKAR